MEKIINLYKSNINEKNMLIFLCLCTFLDSLVNNIKVKTLSFSSVFFGTLFMMLFIASYTFFLNKFLIKTKNKNEFYNILKVNAFAILIFVFVNMTTNILEMFLNFLFGYSVYIRTIMLFLVVKIGLFGYLIVNYIKVINRKYSNDMNNTILKTTISFIISLSVLLFAGFIFRI